MTDGVVRRLPVKRKDGSIDLMHNPVIATTLSEGSRPVIPKDGDHPSERSDAGLLIHLKLMLLSQIRFLFSHRFSF